MTEKYRNFKKPNKRNSTFSADYDFKEHKEWEQRAEREIDLAFEDVRGNVLLSTFPLDK